jgi:hypothetical protein
MKHIVSSVTVAACLLLPSVGAVFAASPGTGGQPSQSCQATPPMPGNTSNAPGSAFNGSAGNVYAGNGQTTMTPANSRAVSQYDVACFQQSVKPTSTTTNQIP